MTLALAAPAQATGGGAGAKGSGDEIISSILVSGRRRNPGLRPGRDTPAPSCSWHTLTDEQVVFLELHMVGGLKIGELESAENGYLLRGAPCVLERP